MCAFNVLLCVFLKYFLIYVRGVCTFNFSLFLSPLSKAICSKPKVYKCTSRNSSPPDCEKKKKTSTHRWEIVATWRSSTSKIVTNIHNHSQVAHKEPQTNYWRNKSAFFFDDKTIISTVVSPTISYKETPFFGYSVLFIKIRYCNPYYPL